MDYSYLNVFVVEGLAGSVKCNGAHPAQVSMLLSLPQAEAWVIALQDTIDRYKAIVESPEGKAYYGRS